MEQLKRGFLHVHAHLLIQEPGTCQQNVNSVILLLLVQDC